MRLLFKKLRARFAARSIVVGHCVTPKGSSVLLCIGRQSAGLTPAGARLVANQLALWADHAETHHEVMTTMKWIVSVSRDKAENAAVSWAAHGLAGAASTLNDDRSAIDENSVAR